MRMRNCAVALLAVLVVLGVAGCQSKVGAAAIVSGDRIAEKTVNTYISTGSPDGIAGARALVLTLLVQERLLEAQLRQHGGVPSAGDLAALHDSSLPTSEQSQGLTGAAADADLRDQIETSNVRGDFLPHYLHVIEMNHVFSTRKLSVDDLVKSKVSISPRYGKWDASNLVVRAFGVQPDFLLPSPVSRAS